jgi:hypothetical protein
MTHCPADLSAMDSEHQLRLGLPAYTGDREVSRGSADLSIPGMDKGAEDRPTRLLRTPPPC